MNVAAHFSREKGELAAGGPMNCSVTVAGIDACSYTVWSTTPASTNGDTTIAGTRTPSLSNANFGVVDVKSSG